LSCGSNKYSASGLLQVLYAGTIGQLIALGRLKRQV
jgi:hypothetical protein